MAAYRFISGVVTVLGLATLIDCGNNDKSSKSAKICPATAQALTTSTFHGSSLKRKNLALTFDDGPGGRTKQLSAYLKSQGIEAAFFINGKNMGADGADILQAVINDGHLVANHTETHRSLTGVSTATARLTDAETLAEVTQTDEKMSPFVPTKRFLFRPPYGDFDDISLGQLSNTPMNKYVGPILWDIGDKMDPANGRAADWDCWTEGTDNARTPMKTCADLYLTEIRHQTNGIVLMHDPYYNEQDPEQLGTVDMVMYMVPILEQEGYAFTRVDKIPEINSVLPPLPADSTGTVAPAEPATPAEDPCR